MRRPRFFLLMVLLAIMPEFGLSCFQVTSATAMRQGIAALPAAPKEA